MRLRRGFCVALVVASAGGLLSVSSAGATTVTVGELFTPDQICSNDTFLQTSVASGRSYTVHKAGVITSWSFEDAASTVSGLKLKVGRSAGGGMYKIVADAAAGVQKTNAVNTYTTHISVKAGDLIGLYTNVFGSLCSENTSNTGDTDVYASIDVPPGTTAPFTSESQSKYPISVKVSLDCIVPKLEGKTLSAAKHALADASCRLGKVTTKVSSGKPGIVLSQNPKPGKRLSPGAKVAVVVSKS